MSDTVEILRKSALFSTLSDEDLAKVAQIAREREFEAGSTLISEGDESALGMWIVLDGEVEVSSEGKTLATFGPGQHVGETALVSKTPRTADVKATKDTRTLQITRWDLKGLTTEHPSITEGIMDAMAARLANTNHALSD